jgi:hypothetical protein
MCELLCAKYDRRHRGSATEACDNGGDELHRRIHWQGSRPRVGHASTLQAACIAAAPPRPTGTRQTKKQDTTLPIPMEMRQQVRNSELIGRQIYILDKVSAIATDVLMARVPDFRNKNIGGYLPFREADDDLRPTGAYVVTFFTKDDPPRIAYEIRVQPDKQPDLKTFDPPKPALSAFVWMAKIRQAAVQALPEHPQPLNPVILPAELLGEKGTMVYLIAGTTRPNLAVFGRHHRVLFSAGATTPSYVMPLSKGILEMPAGPTTATIFVTHILTDWPLETHVFASLLHKKPVYVATRVGLWRVDGDKIALIDDKPPK